MRLERIIPIFFLHRRVGAGLRIRELHVLSEQLEVLEELDGLGGLLGAVEDDKGLPSSLDALLGDDIDDGAYVGKGVAQFLYEFGDFDALVEVADLVRSKSVDVLVRCSKFVVCISYVESVSRQLCSPGLRWFVRSAMYERCVWSRLALIRGHDDDTRDGRGSSDT